MNLFRCRRCLYPNTKPDLWFSDDGVCSACLAYDARKTIDWAGKHHEFLQLVADNRGKSHDVIVACSGGKDSTAQIVKCLELGLRPLAVTATTDHLSDLGRKNLDNVSRLCDHIEVTPNKEVRKKISKFALEEVGDISWCEHHLIWSVPAREAVARNIPIVLYGECPQNEYGAGPKGSETQTRLTNDWVHEFGGLLGLRLDDITDILGIPVRELDIYRRPLDVQAVFMGAYFPWDGLDNAKVALENGFVTHSSFVESSCCDYENLDNLQTGIHDYMRWLKFGYTRQIDIYSNYIRRGIWKKGHCKPRTPRYKFSRDEAIRWVRGWQSGDGSLASRYYLGIPMADILANIGLTVPQFDAICERFTNKPVVEWALRPESYMTYLQRGAA